MTSKDLSRRSLFAGAFAAATLAALGSEAVGATTTPAAATPTGRWILLGSRSVELSGDHSTFPVTFLSGGFTRLQLRVKGNPIYMNDLQVRFSNAESATLPVRARVKDGGETKALELPGGRRYVSFVRLEHRTVPNTLAQTTVEVWGQR
jgi:hypothetical protein